MAKQYSKSDLKNPDLVTAELQKGFGWSVRHSKLVVILIVGLVLFGGLAAVWQTFGNRRELQAQTQYYYSEKAYLDKKEKFEDAEKKSAAPVAKETAGVKSGQKTSEKDPKKDTKSDKEVAAAVTDSVTSLPSGDMEKDYGPEIKGFKEVMTNYSGSKGAKMSALLLSDIYAHYGKSDQATDVLKSITLGNDLFSILGKDRLGSILADAGKCDEAAALWTSIKKETTAAFLKDDIQLREGVCYMGAKNYPQAQAAFKSLDAKSASYGKAEKWLRLIPQDQTSATATK